MWVKASIFIAAFLMATSPANAENFFVNNQAEYRAAANRVRAGDQITLANGTWQSFAIVLTGKGDEAKPITLTAETPGQVILLGQSSLRIGGDYIVVKGLVFRNGYSPEGEVISFRRNKDDLANHARVTETVIDGFSKPDRYDDDYWIGMYGKHNRFDHNYVAGKTNKGVTLAVRLNSEGSRENAHQIDHNYFGSRPTLGSNGGETIRVGTSAFSMFKSNTVIEDNYFEDCDGEIEIISIKSGSNTIRRNVFVTSSGTLTLRHGNDNVVERNVFFGRGKDHTGGIRVINGNQTVRDNYLEGMRGTDLASAFTVMNGVPNSPVYRYVQVTNAQIDHNSILDSTRVTFGAGKSDERSAPPLGSLFTANLLSGTTVDPFFLAEDTLSGIAFSGNVIASGSVPSELSKSTRANVKFSHAANGLLYPVGRQYAGIGAPRDLKPMSRDEAGPVWYAKPVSKELFDSGRTIQVAPGDDTLSHALETSKSGDRIVLSAGDYFVNRTLIVDHAVTFAGPSGSGGRATVSFARPTMFEIANGGSLKLTNLSFSGKEAPDSIGSNFIRTSSSPVQNNFVIDMDHVSISDLNVNASFDVIYLGKGTMAKRISISNSAFSNITGVILNSAAETDDYGQYNSDYVSITDSTFDKIGDGIVNIYRGGTDESTFGPHFTLVRSTLTNVGSMGRGKHGASMLLHGVQYIRIEDNTFARSAPVVIRQTVGVPSTTLKSNTFESTPAPVVEELFFQGSPRAAITGSRVVAGATQ